jgi:RNA recognition motif-containing protein
VAEESAAIEAEESAVEAEQVEQSLESNAEAPQLEAAAERPAPVEHWPGDDVPEEHMQRIIYIGNLFFDVDETVLKEQFESIGHIEKIRVVRDARGMSKG